MAAILDASKLPEPPRPLPPQAKLTNQDGTPTREFHLFLTQVYEWHRALRALLVTPPPTP